MLEYPRRSSQRTPNQSLLCTEGKGSRKVISIHCNTEEEGIQACDATRREGKNSEEKVSKEPSPWVFQGLVCVMRKESSSSFVGRFLVSTPRHDSNLGSLLPRAVKANQTAEGAGQTDDAVVEVEEAETAARNGEVAHVGDELELSDALFPMITTMVSTP